MISVLPTYVLTCEVTLPPWRGQGLLTSDNTGVTGQLPGVLHTLGPLWEQETACLQGNQHCSLTPSLPSLVMCFSRRRSYIFEKPQVQELSSEIGLCSWVIPHPESRLSFTAAVEPRLGIAGVIIPGNQGRGGLRMGAAGL